MYSICWSRLLSAQRSVLVARVLRLQHTGSNPVLSWYLLSLRVASRCICWHLRPKFKCSRYHRMHLLHSLLHGPNSHPPRFPRVLRCSTLHWLVLNTDKYIPPFTHMSSPADVSVGSYLTYIYINMYLPSPIHIIMSL